MGNIMELQVQKHAMSVVDKPAHERRAFRGKEGAGDLDAAYVTFQADSQLGRVYGVIDVECD